MPYVYFLPCAPIYTPDPHEVAEIFTFPLFDLKKEELISRMELKQPNGTVYRNVPYFDVCNKKVWGATALMINELRGEAEEIKSIDKISVVFFDLDDKFKKIEFFID
jgi:hypothetical protein